MSLTSYNAIEEYFHFIVRAFDNLLEQLGTRGNRFEKWCNKLDGELLSEHHNQFLQGFVRLGTLIGYEPIRPKHQSATDCLWRGIFGNYKEIITFEAKIEHTPAGKIIASDIGQAHNQMARAISEYENLGYTIRSSVITHMSKLMPDAESSAGIIRIITKDSISELWETIRRLLTEYRNVWSPDDLNARRQSAESLKPKLPQTGWLIRALDYNARFITKDVLLSEWKQ